MPRHPHTLSHYKIHPESVLCLFQLDPSVFLLSIGVRFNRFVRIIKIYIVDSRGPPCLHGLHPTWWQVKDALRSMSHLRCSVWFRELFDPSVLSASFGVGMESEVEHLVPCAPSARKLEDALHMTLSTLRAKRAHSSKESEWVFKTSTLTGYFSPSIKPSSFSAFAHSRNCKNKISELA